MPHPASAPAPDEGSDALVVQYLPLVQHVVNQVSARYPRHVDRNDLWNAGAYGLVDAARRYDETMGIPFGRYATIRIRGAIIDSTRTRDWASRGTRRGLRTVRHEEERFEQEHGRRPSDQELAERLDLEATQVERFRAAALTSNLLHLNQPIGHIDGEESTLGDLIEDGSEDHRPDAQLEQRELEGTLRYAVSYLPEAQREVIERYYFSGQYLRDIAEHMGVTEARVSQIRSEAINAMRAYLGTTLDGVPTVEESAPGRRRRAAYVAAACEHDSWRTRFAAAGAVGV